jgi:ABC-type nitrate/sulfonate/bicarbonate transport system substrate-binding protein
MLKTIRHIALGCVMMVPCAALTYPAQADPFRVVAFAGASNWPFWVGQEKGFFAADKLEAVLEITPNSTEMAKNLHNGRYDMALTSVDNIVAYDEGQGETDLGGPAQFVALFGVDNGLLNVMASSDNARIEDLKGKKLSVDAMTTGFAFVLRDVLSRHGMSEKDVEWVKVGGGAQRLDTLLKGEQAGTLLNTPLDLAAEAKGFKRLLRVTDVLGAYQGIVGATTRTNAKAKADDIKHFIHAFHASVGWLYDPAHKQDALAILMKNIRGMERPSAEKAYAALLDAKSGIYKDLVINREGMKAVLKLRSTYAEPKKTLTDPEKYIDESLLKAALH